MAEKVNCICRSHYYDMKLYLTILACILTVGYGELCGIANNPLVTFQIYTRKPLPIGQVTTVSDALRPNNDDIFTVEETVTMVEIVISLPASMMVNSLGLVRVDELGGSFLHQFGAMVLNRNPTLPPLPTLTVDTPLPLETETPLIYLVVDPLATSQVLPKSLPKMELYVPCTVSGSYPINVQNAATCPDEWWQNGDFCYYFGSKRFTWDNAMLECPNIDSSSTLVQFDTQTEFEELRQHLINTPELYARKRYWTSGKLVDDQWQWIGTGDDIPVWNWGKGEPNKVGNNEKCLNIRRVQPESNCFKYNDSNCNKKQNIICRRSP